MSLSLREDIYSAINETPGPGQYDVRPVIVKNIKGGSSLSNKSQRFNEKLKENPGPGAYIIENKENKALPVELRVKNKIFFSRKFAQIQRFTELGYMVR